MMRRFLSSFIFHLFRDRARYHLANGPKVDVAKAPLLCGASVDLYLLYKLVQVHGGMAKAAANPDALNTIFYLLPSSPPRAIAPGTQPALLLLQLYSQVRATHMACDPLAVYGIAIASFFQRST